MHKILCLFFLILSVSASGRAYALGSDFRNQFAVLGYGRLDDTLGNTVGRQKFMDIAKQFGYEWIIGEPYDSAKASLGVTNGLKVMYNSNNARAAKWVRFNNPNPDATGFGEPTTVDWGAGVKQLSAAGVIPYLRDTLLLDTALCQTSNGTGAGAMAVGNFYDETLKGQNAYRYQIYYPDNKNTIIFVPNLRSNAGVNAHVAGEINNYTLQENNTGKKLYAGLYMDEVTFKNPPDSTNCPNAVNGTGALTWVQGRSKEIVDLKAAITTKVGTNFGGYGGTSGNPYDADNLDPEYTTVTGYQLDFVYNEASGGQSCDTIAELTANNPHGCGGQNTDNFGNVPAAVVQTGLAPTNRKGVPIMWERDYTSAALVMGRAAGNPLKPWGGWFNNALTPTYTLPIMYLVRAIPTWDNLRVAGSRVWNETTKIYTSDNSRIDQNIVWGRHKDYEINHKFFVSPHLKANAPTITLKANEKVVDAKCTDIYFIENANNCVDSGFFSQSGTTVTLGGSIVNDSGYVLTVHHQPSFLTAKVEVADTLDFCWAKDDTVNMLPDMGSTGWIVTVVPVGGGAPQSKVPQSTSRLLANCFRLIFQTGTITSSAQAVTVAYTAGGAFPVSAGTNMIGTNTKVPVTNVTVQNAVNTISGGGGGTPSIAETKYQWQNNVGSAEGATLYGTLNSTLAPSPGGQARLIVKYRNTVAAHPATQLPLCYAIDPVDPTSPSGGVPLTDSCAGNDVCYTHAIGIGDLAPSTELLASDETVNIPCGVIQSQNSVPTLNFSTNSEAECIYAIRFKETLTPGQKVYFYPQRDTGNLSQYTTGNLPHAIIQEPRSDQINGTFIGGTYH